MTDFTVADAAIRQLYACYADAVWREDAVAFGDCLATNVEWRISGHVHQGRAACVTHITAAFPRFRWISINLKQPIIAFQDGQWTGRTFFREESVLADGTPFAAMGTYYDRYVDQGDRWRFQWRYFQTHYAGKADLSENLFATTDFGAPPAMPPHDATTTDRFSAPRRTYPEG